MSNLYLPEGRLLHTPENQAAWETLSSLRQAMEQETVLEGRAVLCTPGHDLLVNLGPFTGTIPRRRPPWASGREPPGKSPFSPGWESPSPSPSPGG